MVMTAPAGSVSDLLAKKYGVKVNCIENPEITASGAAAAVLVKNNPRRLGLVLINLGANTVYLGLARDVSAAKGIAVAPNGGPVSMDMEADFILPTREWWVISPAGASNLYSLSVEIYS